MHDFTKLYDYLTLIRQYDHVNLKFSFELSQKFCPITNRARLPHYRQSADSERSGMGTSCTPTGGSGDP